MVYTYVYCIMERGNEIFKGEKKNLLRLEILIIYIFLREKVVSGYRLFLYIYIF